MPSLSHVVHLQFGSTNTTEEFLKMSQSTLWLSLIIMWLNSYMKCSNFSILKQYKVTTLSHFTKKYISVPVLHIRHSIIVVIILLI